jgi:succinoglycan biosynthesis transport protein ExoP
MNPPRKTSSSRGSQEKESAPLSLDYDHLSRLCLKYWKWLVGGVLGGAVAGLLFSATQTTIYEARSTIVVQSNKDAVPGVVDVGRADTSSSDLLKTFEQLLQTKDLVQRVVKSEHLNENAEFLNGITPPISEDDATSILAKDVTIRIRPLTRLIDITVDHHSPHMAKLLADKLAQESITQEFDQQTETATALSDDLQKEVTQLQQKVEASEQALHDYQASHKEGGAGISLDPSEDIVVANYKDLNQQYMSAQAQVTLLKERYGEQHPKLIQAEKTMEELGNEVRKAQEGALASSGLSIGYNALKSAAEANKLQLTNLQNALNATQVATRVTNPGIAVANLAELPLAPVRPSKSKAVALGGFVGLLGGLGFIFGLYFIDSSLRTVAQAEGTLGVSVIAAVPILTESDGKTVLPTYSDPQSFVAESFRGLRAALLLQDRENPLKTILVVSAIPGEGKSFCAANLAVAFAQAGLKTLLIDADLRLPTLHTYFDIPPGEQKGGLMNVLAGRITLPMAVVPSPLPTLELLLTTTPADSPAELLSGGRLPRLLDEAASKYDRVVIDSAPLNAVSDTMLIMPKAEAILLVVRAAQTPANESKAALQKIYSSKMKPMGLILNYLAAHTLKSYAYGYSYGQKPKEKNAK